MLQQVTAVAECPHAASLRCSRPLSLEAFLQQRTAGK